MNETTVTSELVERMDDLRSVAYIRGYLDGYRDAVKMMGGDFAGNSHLREHILTCERFIVKYGAPAPELHSVKA